jgi:hypothetical protein
MSINTFPYGNIVVSQMVLEVLVPTASNPQPVSSYAVKITLRGTNRRPSCAQDQPDYAEIPKLPDVKRAL